MNLCGGRVRGLRARAHMTRESLAGQLSMVTAGAWDASANEVMRIERGERIVTDIELDGLARALRTSVQFLATGQHASVVYRRGTDADVQGSAAQPFLIKENP
jgi:transcriptional regulator with XRE-family HTH domain